MKALLSALTMATLLSVSAFAGSWSGKLVDATCYDNQHKADSDSQKKTDAEHQNKTDAEHQNKADSCDPTSTTTAFALMVSGKAYKLDTAGNTKASEALKNRADRSTDPAKPAPSSTNATVTGTESGGTITVETIDVN